jgi:speckle-type POZ protein
MSSSFTAGEPSMSASTIVANTARGCHILKIDGYSSTKVNPNGEAIKSGQFTVGGHRWRITYYPNGRTPDSADYISLYLELDEKDTKCVKAKFQMRFASLVTRQPSLKSAAAHTMTTDNGRGYPKFVKREDLEKSEHLKDDAFTVRCDIVVFNEFRAEATAVANQFVTVPQSDLKQHLGDLLRGEKGADVVFSVGGETFAAHRCVLAARSTVFSAELLGPMKEGGNGSVVCVDDMEAQVFKALLCFVYTDSLPETEEEDEGAAMLQHLLVAADRYNLERLKLICQEKLCSHIDVRTVATILVLAEQHRCDGLKRACFAFLSSPVHLMAVMITTGFVHLRISCPAVAMELVARCLAPLGTSAALRMTAPNGTKRARVDETGELVWPAS